MKTFATIFTSLVGLSLAVFGFGTAFEEAHKASPSLWIGGAFFALGLIGTLMTPFVGDKVAAAAKEGISLGSLGRRAYDGKVDVPKVDP